MTINLHLQSRKSYGLYVKPFDLFDIGAKIEIGESALCLYRRRNENQTTGKNRFAGIAPVSAPPGPAVV